MTNVVLLLITEAWKGRESHPIFCNERLNKRKRGTATFTSRGFFTSWASTICCWKWKRRYISMGTWTRRAVRHLLWHFMFTFKHVLGLVAVMEQSCSLGKFWDEFLLPRVSWDKETIPTFPFMGLQFRNRWTCVSNFKRLVP